MGSAQFRFTGSLHGIKFDKGKFTKAFEIAAQRLVREAAREWLRAVLTQVPIWTGFAQGSIVFAKGPGGDLARYVKNSVSVSQRYDTPKWYYPGDGSRVRKTPQNGGRFGEYNFPSSQHRYRFRFTNHIIHFTINEFYSDISYTSPWHSMEAGKSAFYDYLQANAKNLPKVKKYLVTAVVAILGGD